jgi:hypothetical protein
LARCRAVACRLTSSASTSSIERERLEPLALAPVLKATQRVAESQRGADMRRL